MSKYRCSKSKDEILTIIVDHFEDIHEDLDTCYSNENHGRYSAMIDLLYKLEIYEEVERCSL